MSKQLTIVIDLGDFYCFMALAPTLRLLNEHKVNVGKVNVKWLPMRRRKSSSVNRYASADSEETKAEKLRREYKHKRMLARQKNKQNELKRAAQVMLVEVTVANVHHDVSFAHEGLLMLNDKSIEPSLYLAEVFNMLFRRNEVLSEAVITALLKHLYGISSEEFLAYQQQKSKLNTDEAPIFALFETIQQLPAYILDMDLFQGRAHLPLIQKLLQV